MRRIFIDGIWNTGKTTIAELLAEQEKLVFIREPVFPVYENNKVPGSIIDEWYIKSFEQNSQLADSLEQDCVLERSVLSALTFMSHKGIPLSNYTVDVRESDVYILFDVKIEPYLTSLSRMEDFKQNIVQRNQKLIIEYSTIYKKVAEKMRISNIDLIEVFNEKGFLPKDEILQQIKLILNRTK